MAKRNKIVIDVNTVVNGAEQVGKLTVDLKQLGAAAERVQTTMGAVKWASVVQGAEAVNQSISSLIGTMRDLSAAYAVQEEAERKLETVMRQRMDATDAQIQSIKDLCSAQQEIGVIGDEVQLAGAQQIATFITQKSTLEQLIPAMNNLVAQQRGLNATQGDCVSVANLMGKAMQGNVNALKRVGITFTEAEAKVMKFGNESERASMLAQIITNNVGEMNAQLAQTDSGRMKQLENTMGDLKEQLGSMVSKALPFFSIAAAATTATTGVFKLVGGVKALLASTAVYNLRAKTAAVVTALLGVNARSTAVLALRLRNALGMTSTAARVAAVSIRGLMIATGVGAVIVALTYALDALCSSMSETAEAAEEMTDAEGRLLDVQKQHQKDLQEYQRKSSDYAAEEMTRLDLLYNKAMDETKSREARIKAIKELQQMYPEYFGNVVAEISNVNALRAAYESLANDIIAASEARAAFEEMTEAKRRILQNQKAIDDMNNQREALGFYVENEKKGNTTSPTPSAPSGSTGTQTPVRHLDLKPKKRIFFNADGSVDLTARSADGTKFLDQVGSMAAVMFTDQIAQKQKAIDEDKKYIAYLASKAQNYDPNKTFSHPVANLAGAGGRSGSAAAKPTETEEDRAKKLSVGEILGRDLKTLNDYEEAIRDLTTLQKYSAKEDAQSYQELIDKLNEERDAFKGIKKEIPYKKFDKDNSTAFIMAAGKDCVEDYTQAISVLEDRLKTASDTEYAALSANIKLLKDELTSFQRIMPAAIDKLNTQKEINDALAVYRQIQEGQSGEEWYATQKTIAGLEKKAQQYDSIAEAMAKVKAHGEMLDLKPRELKVKVNELGFDGLTEQIKEIDKLLANVSLPVELRTQLEGMRTNLVDWRKEAMKGFATYRKGWESIKGVNTGINDMVDALKSSNTVWEKAVSVIDGMLTVFDGINSGISIVRELIEAFGLMSTATEAASAAKAAATATDAASSATQVVTNKTEAASWTQLAAAKIYAKYAGLPIVGIGVASAEVVSMEAAVAAAGIPKFAEGGIAYGPTLGLFGEYIGAGSNPEVVAPLDRLQDLIEPRTNIGGEVRFKIESDALVGVLRKHERRNR